LRSMSELTGCVLVATDGEIGRCKDFLFDDEAWVLRYMVADTGRWIPHRAVLISPESLGEPVWVDHRFPVQLSKADIENGPALDSAQPVSRQHEEALASHYGLPFYWSAPDAPHLRSFQEIVGYRVMATDDHHGHVDDLMVDDQDWTIRYLVVDTRDWLPGRKVLISPRWLRAFDWTNREARIDLTPSQLEISPVYEPERPIYRAYEAELHEAYGRKGYWNS
jgi:hypothetical protein